MEKFRFLDPSDRQIWLQDEWGHWDWAAHSHDVFKAAFEKLVSEGCVDWALLDLLDRLHDCQDHDVEGRASPKDIRQFRAGLEVGRHALLALVEGFTLDDLFGDDPASRRVVREDWKLLRYSRDDVDAALKLLEELSDQLKTLKRGADRRRNRIGDQYRAILVRYVKRQTGKLHDPLVCDLLEVALSETPGMDYFEVEQDEDEKEDQAEPEIDVAVDPNHTWPEITVEAHRRWRGRNKRLIDNPPTLEAQWEQGLKQQAEERGKPAELKPQRRLPVNLGPKTLKHAGDRKK